VSRVDGRGEHGGTATPAADGGGGVAREGFYQAKRKAFRGGRAAYNGSIHRDFPRGCWLSAILPFR